MSLFYYDIHTTLCNKTLLNICKLISKNVLKTHFYIISLSAPIQYNFHMNITIYIADIHIVTFLLQN